MPNNEQGRQLRVAGPRRQLGASLLLFASIGLALAGAQAALDNDGDGTGHQRDLMPRGVNEIVVPESCPDNG